MSAGVAYFSAEFGLNENLPIYSGGLGILAGDHIKSAAELELPLTGVGLFYSKGYFQQRIREDGVQEHHYPAIDTSKLPIRPLLDEEKRPLIIEVPIAERRIAVKAWVVEIGKVPVYLLSSDVETNQTDDRRLTDNLYPSDPDIRIRQEIILGIGGARLLQALGIRPAVWHMNEGHSAFLALERIRQMSAEGIAFDTAMEAVKASTVFTTHTPVPAGHDIFSLEMMDRYFGDFYWQMGADRDQVLELGRIGNGFNMTRLAIRTSCRVNGVSELHAAVSQALFHQWTPHIPKEDIPVESITNGVHAGTWISPELQQLYTRYLPDGWQANVADSHVWAAVGDIPANELWESHLLVKETMVKRLAISVPSVQDTLMIGFARRFATYKRALLVFQDLERLSRIVNDADRPVCLVFAGKAHPADGPGQALLRQLVEMSRDDRFKHRIIVAENYDMKLGKLLVQGVDVWLNTPLKPMEASGTSGQKAALNGVLNCSVLDGWWAEGYDGRNGWAIEGTMGGSSDEDRSRLDAEALYDLLEREIIPLYHRRDSNGVPAEWVDKMKHSIRTLAPRFNTHRMVGQYRSKLYEPTAVRGTRFAADGYEIARKLAAYKRFIRDHWEQVCVSKLRIHSSQSSRIGLTDVHFQAQVRLGPIWERDVQVEAVGCKRKGGIWRVKLSVAKKLESGLYQYEGTVYDTLDAMELYGANVRVTPVSPEFANDFEMELAAWG